MMASVSRTGGVAPDNKGGVAPDNKGGVAPDRGSVGSDVPEGATLYDPRKSYSMGEVIWHEGWKAEGTVVDFAPPRSTLLRFPQKIKFRDYDETTGSEQKPVFMDVDFKSSVGADRRSGIKTLICNIPVKDYHIPPSPQQIPVKGGVGSDNPKGGVGTDNE